MSKQDKIICLGKEFASDDERRNYFRSELRSKLPELKKIEGFPIGTHHIIPLAQTLGLTILLNNGKRKN